MGYDTRDKGFLVGKGWYRFVLGLWGAGLTVLIVLIILTLIHGDR
jgi:hypothetical protein